LPLPFEFILLIGYDYHGSSSSFQLVIKLHLWLIIQIFDGFPVHTIDGLLIVCHCAWLVWAYFIWAKFHCVISLNCAMSWVLNEPFTIWKPLCFLRRLHNLRGIMGCLVKHRFFYCGESIYLFVDHFCSCL